MGVFIRLFVAVPSVLNDITSIVRSLTLGCLVAQSSVLLAPVSAHGQTEGVRLEYTAAMDQHCVDARAFIDLVQARLGHPPFDEEGETALEVTVARSPAGRFVARLIWRDAAGEVRGQRELEGADCQRTTDAIAAAASIAIESIEEVHRMARGPEDVPPGVHPPEAPPIVEPATVVSSEPRGAEDDTIASALASTSAMVPSDPEVPPLLQTPVPEDPEADLTTRLWLGVGLGYGPNPLPYTDFSLGAGLRFGDFVTWLTVHYGDTFAKGEANLGYGLRSWLVRGRGALCYAPDPVELCGTGSGGVLAGEASTVSNPGPGQLGFGSLGGSVAVVPTLADAVALRIGLSLEGTLQRAAFTVGDDVVWTTFPLLGQLEVSLLMEL